MPHSFRVRLIPLLVATLISASGFKASAQSMSHPDSISPLKPNPYLKHQEPWRWDIRSQVFLRAGIVVINRREYREERTGSFSIEDFEYIYPIVREGGHYWSPNEDVDATLRIDDAEFTPKPTILQTPDSHSPYAWWRSNQRDKRTHQLHFTQLSHIVCADTVFNEELAKQIPWPDAWPADAERFLSPIVDQVHDPVDPQAQDHLARLVDGWMEGNDPKSIDQVTLAKFLTGKVIEHVRVRRGSMLLAPTVHTQTNDDVLQGFSVFPLSSWSGFIVRSADQVAIEPAGTALDLSTMLTAVLRTAGIPARLVICYDNSQTVQVEERVRAIVEFAMYDKERDQTLWIPVDPQELRDNGRRSQYYKQPWLYFGTHDQLRNFVPLAYYFHPPVNYKAYGYPGLFGLKTSPDIGDRISQILSIDVINTPVRGDDPKRPSSP